MIERLFMGRLPQHGQQELYSHIEGCPSCEDAYERWAKAEAALFSGGSDSTPLQLDRVRERLFEVSEPPRDRKRILAGLGAFAAAMGTLLLFLFVRPTTPTEEFRVRGGAETPLSQRVNIRVLRVRGGESGRPEVVDLSSGGVELRVGDRVQLLYTNLEDFRFLSVGFVDSSGKTRSVVKGSAIGSAMEDGRIGSSMTIPEDTSPGWVRWVGVFSKDQPAPGSIPYQHSEAGDSEKGAIRVVSAQVAGPRSDNRGETIP
jgi:hypothetical protein